MEEVFTHDNSVNVAMDNSVVFSIIVPAFNEEKYIEELLVRLVNFETDNFKTEIIIIDNGSTDTTLSIIKKYPCSVYILPQATIAEMRNYGTKMAHGKWVGFIDADCMPTKEWLVRAKERLENNREIGIIGSFYSKTYDATWVEQLWFSMRQATVGQVSFLPAGNMAVRRSEFIELGGFPGDMITGEDYALCQKYIRSGYLIFNDLSMQNIHYGNVKRLVDIFKKESWYGLSLQKSLKENLREKVFWATMVFHGGCLLVIILSVFMFFFDAFWLKSLLILGVICVGGVISSYALIATIRSGKMTFFLGYALIFLYYFLGRSVAIYYLLGEKLSRL
jgi:glycosyltransferase involved in cell wall biosynthesis